MDTLKQGKVENSQACAKLATETPGGLFWTFYEVNSWCGVRNSEVMKKTGVMNWTTGNRECGFLSKDQWDQKLSEPISLSPEIRQDLEKMPGQFKERTKHVFRARY